MLTRNNIIKTLFLVTVLTVVDHWLLTTIDQLMAEHTAGYRARSSYFFANSLYFTACFITIICGLLFGWTRMLPFIYIAVAVFFPLIFLSSCWEVYVEMDTTLKAYYQQALCDITNNHPLCGKALAHMVFSRVISALPLLFMTPLLFYIVVKIGYFDFSSKSKNVNVYS